MFIDKAVFSIYSKSVYKTLILLYLRLIRRLNSPARIIDFSIKKYAQSPFVIQPDLDRNISFKEFGERIEKLVFFFNAIGLTGADTIAFSSKNSFEYFEVRAACHKLGAIFLGLPSNLSAEDTVYFLNKTKAKIFFHRQFMLGDLNVIKKEAGVKCCIDLDNSEYKDIFQKIKGDARLLRPGACTEQSRSGARNDTQLVSGDEEKYSICTFNLSSGTTGKTPKIIQLTDQNWVESLYGIIRNADIEAGKKGVFLCTVSFLTSGSTTFLPVILSGISNIVVHEDIEPRRLAEVINQYKVTRLYITPSRLLELLEWCKLNNEKLTSLENITIGTERMPALKLKEAIGFFGAKISVGYGMVEALPPIAMLGAGEYGSEVSPPKTEERPPVQSVGRVCKGVEVKISEDGRVVVKSKTVSLGYLDNHEENAKCFKDGLFYTNDYGFIDKQGYLHILGRKEEILRESPRRIFAREIEDKVYELLFVNRCAAVAKDGKITVFVSLRGKVDADEAKRKILQSACGLLQDDKVSQEDIEIVIKESLPINYAGKLDRKALDQVTTCKC